MCHSSVILSEFNGKLTVPFACRKDLRHGDPMSQFLFFICMKYLTELLKEAKREFRFHLRCKVLGINHLIFAYDFLLFCNGGVKPLKCLIDTLDVFCITSGLRMNKSKSEIYCA